MNTQSNFSWEEMDKLNRRQDALDIIRFLQNKFGETLSFSLNINAEWGYGKTRLLEGINHELKSANTPNLTIYFDAWKNDLSPDPLGNFITSVTKELLSHFENQALVATEGKLRSGLYTLGKIASTMIVGAASRYVGKEATESLIDLFGNQDSENKVLASKVGDDTAKATIENFNKMMTEVESRHKSLNQIDIFKQVLKGVFDEIQLGNTNMLPIYILVDELDRCRPTYAIELLECIKHLFSTDGVYFIFATNTEQLCHTICKVYGDKFDARKYLRRFFDLEYHLMQPNYEAYATYLFDQNTTISEKLVFPGGWTPAKSFSECMTAFDVPPREQLKIFNHMCACCTLSENGDKIVYPIMLLLVTIFFRYESIYRQFRSRNGDIGFKPFSDANLGVKGEITNSDLFDMRGTGAISIIEKINLGVMDPGRLILSDFRTDFSVWLYQKLFESDQGKTRLNGLFSLIDRVRLI